MIKFEQTKECQIAFHNIKELLITPPVLHMAIATEKCRLESDTSRTATGGGLLFLISTCSVDTHWIPLKEATTSST